MSWMQIHIQIHYSKQGDYADYNAVIIIVYCIGLCVVHVARLLYLRLSYFN